MTKIKVGRSEDLKDDDSDVLSRDDSSYETSSSVDSQQDSDEENDDEDDEDIEEEEDEDDDDDEEEEEEVVESEFEASTDNESDEFEEQGSSDEESLLEKQRFDAENESDDELEILENHDDIEATFESIPRRWKNVDRKKVSNLSDLSESVLQNKSEPITNDPELAKLIHTDDYSSDDDEDGITNRIGRVPLHWYDDYEHIGYDVHGSKVIKSSSAGKDFIDRSIQKQDNMEERKFVVHDSLHATDVTLTPRQLELIRRIQSGAFAHPEFQAFPDYIDYFSGVDKEISGISSDRHELKARFQPSKFEKAQVRMWLSKLKNGSVSIDFLKGKIRDMNDVTRKKKESNMSFLLWKGDEEDELNNRKGPQHIAAPKMSPPTHAESYNPAEEYLPTEEEKKAWEDLDVNDRPHGLLIPKKFPNLRSVGAYEHAVRESFERCLDLYLCPRVLKRRLNIDPESLVPQLPKASDLRPYPTSLAVRYDIPRESGEDLPMIRCLTVSLDGQYLVSGDSFGYLRMWEVQTGRLLRSWNLSALVVAKNGSENEIKPVVAVEWNPNHSHHCLIAAVATSAIIIATGTGSVNDATLTEALLSAADSCKSDGSSANVKCSKASRVVKWKFLIMNESDDNNPISAFGGRCGPIVAIETTHEVTNCKWQKKGDYFLTVSPKAGSAAVLIHQLSKANSQQPFSKSKSGDVQCACFHPNKPFLFVASQQHIRVYHLVKQSLVKRLLSGCKWISTIDVHNSGDHLIAGSLDRRMVWFDLDLSNTPYKTLKYHEKALRCVAFHSRYPLMASSSDDGSVHVFHSMVYSDLMRNPLIVPVKVLKGYSDSNAAILSIAFHPNQPWLFSAGADGQITLYQDI